ncbi:MAG: hypothetical protein WC812_03030 [Candidatus Pacearchaeota archaeon]|jgi:hypothetical protein
MKNKRASHVDVTISFIIFVLFLTFLFIFTKFPEKSESDQDLSLGLVKNSMVNYLSSDVTIYYIKNSSIKTSENCIMINELSLDPNLKNIVKDINENNIYSKRESGNLYISWISGQSLFKSYYSEENFSNFNLTGSLNCQTGEINSIQEQNKIMETKILKMIQEYSSNYSYLKSNIGIPQNEDFNVQFEYANKTIIGQNMTEIKASVFVKNFQIDYLDVNGNEKIGNLIIYLW